MPMTEDVLVQEVTADYLLNELKWDESFMGLHERMGKEGISAEPQSRKSFLPATLVKSL